MTGDGTRAVVELPDFEADAIRDEAFAATHAHCLICSREICEAQWSCGCGAPAPIPLDPHGLDVACSENCAAMFEREGNA